MKKVAVLTGTRAEYGLLYWTIRAIEEDTDLQLQLIVTGAHLSPDHGFTVNEIEKSAIPIKEKIEVLISSDSKQGIAKSMGLLMINLAQTFERLKPDILLLLGDRYELLAAASTAVAMNIPIAHLCGGESTEGAIDEQIRHAITKLSHIHFTQTEYYKQQIIKMGEEKWRVNNIGFIGFENIKRMKLLSREELEMELQIPLGKKIFVVTYHPVTLENDKTEEQIDILLKSIDGSDATIIFTYPNADCGGRLIINKIKAFRENKTNVYIFYSLGQKKYLSLLKYADIMIGNSSSGILEAPYFDLPVINIGNRQKGRIRFKNIIDVECSAEAIINAIKLAAGKGFTKHMDIDRSFFGDGLCSKHIIEGLKEGLGDSRLMYKKLHFEE